MTRTAKPTDGHPRRFRRGQRIEYTYAGGKTVPGVIVRYQDMSAVPGRPDLRGQVGWYAVRLNDEAGAYDGSCHEQQIRLTDNRA